ncbi:MAG: EFR1 family ferrodoxin [Oscillospiraceae bacterium]|nr:EFR1 family ferrodoxin [Oscillospiraceae bacterium]
MILYYTGTGNSAHVAKRLGALLHDEVEDLFSRLRDGDHTSLYSDDAWVIVTPTYGWRIPGIVTDWLRKTELVGSRSVYFVMTCGDGIGAAGKYAEKLCRDRGLQYRGCAPVIMPENYIAMFDAPGEAEARRIVAAAEPVIAELAQRIAGGETLSVPVGRTDALLSGPVNRGFFAFWVKDRAFRVSDACVGCGVCRDVCPMRNITLVSDRPRWNGTCTHCMACITRCPKQAIEYGRISRGKPRYQCPK